MDVPHQDLKHGDRCPECGKGNVYEQKESKVLVRIVGQALLAATVYSLERLRCAFGWMRAQSGSTASATLMHAVYNLALLLIAAVSGG